MRGDLERVDRYHCSLESMEFSVSFTYGIIYRFSHYECRLSDFKGCLEGCKSTTQAMQVLLHRDVITYYVEHRCEKIQSTVAGYAISDLTCLCHDSDLCPPISVLVQSNFHGTLYQSCDQALCLPEIFQEILRKLNNGSLQFQLGSWLDLCAPTELLCHSHWKCMEAGALALVGPLFNKL